jgi:hypothetical protein
LTHWIERPDIGSTDRAIIGFSVVFGNTVLRNSMQFLPSWEWSEITKDWITIRKLTGMVRGLWNRR